MFKSRITGGGWAAVRYTPCCDSSKENGRQDLALPLWSASSKSTLNAVDTTTASKHPQLAAVNQFLRYLHGVDKAAESARPGDVAGFIAEKRKQYEKRHGGSLPREPKWRYGYTGPIHRMLRLIDPEWPRPDPPRSERERFQRELLEDYGRWITDDHGLSEATRRKNVDSTQCFLSWLESNGRPTLMDLSVAHIDAYLAWALGPASPNKSQRSLH